MSLYITVQVTKTPTHLEQIHQLTITNLGITESDGRVRYRATLDGEIRAEVLHNPGDGALVLMHKALTALRPY